MSSYDKFAIKYSDSMGEEGDYFHKKYIDPAVYELVGDVQSKNIYDIACGNGYMTRSFLRNGANKVYASDISEKLIQIAKSKSKDMNIVYSHHDATDFSSYQDGQFDVVTMNMAIHYIEDLFKLFAGISRILKSNGRFVFSTNHFFRLTWPYSEWTDGKIYGQRKIYIKVHGYLENKKVKIESYWDKDRDLVIYNRPLNFFIDKLSKHNLFVTQVREPETPEFPRSSYQELENDHHIPTFIILRTDKLKPNL